MRRRVREEHGELSAPSDLFTASRSCSVPAALKSERCLRDIFYLVLVFPPLNFALREEDFAHLSQRCQPQLPTSLYRPPDVFTGLRSLFRWWNFLGFPAWKRSIQLISDSKQPHLTAPRATQPVTPRPNILTDPRTQRHSARLHLWTVLAPEGLGAPFGGRLRRR